MSLEQLNKKKNIYKHYKEMYLETKYIYNIYLYIIHIYFEYDKIKLILCTIKLMKICFNIHKKIIKINSK